MQEAFLQILRQQEGIFSVQRPNSSMKFRQVLRVVLLAIHSHLYSFALRFLFLQIHATSYVFLQTYATSSVFLQLSYCIL
jgi:hypothetical protein